MERKRDDQLTEQEKKIISERIKNAMVRKLINQKELGEMIGVSRSAMSRAVTGSVITLGYLMKISKALNVSMDYLCGFSSKEDYFDIDVGLDDLRQKAKSMIKEILDELALLGIEAKSPKEELLKNAELVAEQINHNLQRNI